VRINGETHYLWRAVDHEDEVLDVLATKRRNRRATLNFLKRAMKRFGRPTVLVTDRLQSHRAAMNVIGIAASQECGRWLNPRDLFKQNQSAALAEWHQLAGRLHIGWQFGDWFALN
jgi:putative transposase